MRRSERKRAEPPTSRALAGSEFDARPMPAMASREERSRSPPGALALPTRAPLSFDLDKMELSLDGQVVKVCRFADEPDAPWFPAKALSIYLEYLQVTRALDHVDAEDRRSLKALLETKGVPLGVGADFAPPLGYHEGKAVYINESGLYSLIFGSKKPEAKEFKLWVTRQALAPRPARARAAAPAVARQRQGPYARALQGGSSAVSSQSIRSFFGPPRA